MLQLQAPHARDVLEMIHERIIPTAGEFLKYRSGMDKEELDKKKKFAKPPCFVCLINSRFVMLAHVAFAGGLHPGTRGGASKDCI